jgi:putative flippase GtrA
VSEAGTVNLFKRMRNRRGVRQFVKFGIVGASGFVVNLVVFTLLQRVVPDRNAAGPYFAIFSIAFLTGGVSNYFLNRVWTFRSTGHAGREGLQFMSVSVLALLVGLVVSAIIARAIGHYGHAAWLGATLSGIVVNFFVNKYWTFRSVR